MKRWGCVFVLSSQLLSASKENSLCYDEWASGRTVYLYVGGNPLRYSDPTGLVVETLYDIGALSYDVYCLIADGPEEFDSNLGALGVDVAATLVPGVPAIGGVGIRAGKSFTKKGKQIVKEENAAKNSGAIKCEKCGQETVPPQQHQKGVTPPANEAHVDHINPKSKGGAGSPENGQVLCRTCNLEKKDK